MKTILMLGGSSNQVSGIKKAKELGYRVVLCDNLPNNPGRSIADAYYEVSTTDRKAVIAVAMKEHVDGATSYSSDAAAPTAAYVTERLRLPGNPLSSVELLCDKGRLREALRNEGVAVPASIVADSPDDACRNCPSLPVIVKPVDGSGSKGVTVVRTEADLLAAVDKALRISRCGRAVIEEHIDDSGGRYTDGDIIVVDGKIRLWGIVGCFRDAACGNGLVPTGDIYPAEISGETFSQIKRIVQKLVECSGYRNGAINAEFLVDAEGTPWPIDFGPRCGGNLIPELLSRIFGVDIIEAILRISMGEDPALPSTSVMPTRFCAKHILHGAAIGILDSIEISPKISSHVFLKQIIKHPGDLVEPFSDASKSLGILLMEFSGRDEMDDAIAHIGKYVHVNLRS